MFADELIDILTSKSQHGTPAAESNHGNPWRSARAVIADPGPGDLQQFRHIGQTEQGRSCFGLAGKAVHRFASLVTCLRRYSSIPFALNSSFLPSFLLNGSGVL